VLETEGDLQSGLQTSYVSDGHVQKGNKERPWTMVYLGDRVIGERARVERRHEGRRVC